MQQFRGKKFYHPLVDQTIPTKEGGEKKLIYLLLRTESPITARYQLPDPLHYNTHLPPPVKVIRSYESVLYIRHFFQHHRDPISLPPNVKHRRGRNLHLDTLIRIDIHFSTFHHTFPPSSKQELMIHSLMKFYRF